MSLSVGSLLRTLLARQFGAELVYPALAAAAINGRLAEEAS